MIQKDYLSEVEATYVQGRVLVDAVPEDRLTSIWAVVGKDIHGFAAVIESSSPVGSSWLVKFSPVCDIVALRSHTVPGKSYTEKNGHVWEQEEYHVDVLKYQPKDHAMRFCELSKRLDTEKICSVTPTIGEDLVTV